MARPRGVPSKRFEQILRQYAQKNPARVEQVKERLRRHITVGLTALSTKVKKCRARTDRVTQYLLANASSGDSPYHVATAELNVLRRNLAELDALRGLVSAQVSVGGRYGNVMGYTPEQIRGWKKTLRIQTEKLNKTMNIAANLKVRLRAMVSQWRGDWDALLNRFELIPEVLDELNNLQNLRDATNETDKLNTTKHSRELRKLFKLFRAGNLTDAQYQRLRKLSIKKIMMTRLAVANTETTFYAFVLRLINSAPDYEPAPDFRMHWKLQLARSERNRQRLAQRLADLDLS